MNAMQPAAYDELVELFADTTVAEPAAVLKP
jgi:hypothetical protein